MVEEKTIIEILVLNFLGIISENKFLKIRIDLKC